MPSSRMAVLVDGEGTELRAPFSPSGLNSLKQLRNCFSDRVHRNLIRLMIPYSKTNERG